MKALITGSSRGIGASFARVLASRGVDLILVARSKSDLLKLKKELDVDVEIIESDLTKLDNVYKLYEMCKDKKIDILINNAGFGLFGEFFETDLDRELEMIDLNIKALHVLTKLFLNDFFKKDSGYILNVALSAGFMAGPKLSTYYATKNYCLKLTMAINEELRKRKSNVVVSALCPGPVNTNFNKVANGKFSIKGTTPEICATYAIDKLFKKKMIIIPTLKIKLGIFMLRLIPYRTQLKIIYKIQGRKLEKKR